MTTTALAIHGIDSPTCPEKLTATELIMPSYSFTRVGMLEDQQGYWTARVYQDALAISDLWVSVPQRHKGIGAMLLQSAIDHADSLGLPTALYAAANELQPKAMTREELWYWYIRRGFMPHPDFAGIDYLMIRPVGGAR